MLALILSHELCQEVIAEGWARQIIVYGLETMIKKQRPSRNHLFKQLQPAYLDPRNPYITETSCATDVWLLQEPIAREAQ